MADMASILEALYGIKPSEKKVAPPPEQTWSERVVGPLGRQMQNMPNELKGPELPDTLQDYIMTPQMLKHNRDNLNTPGLSTDNEIGYKLPETQAFESPAHYNIMQQARALHPALNNPLAGPDLNKGGMKEFMLRALQLAPQGLGPGKAAVPQPNPITGGSQHLVTMSPEVQSGAKPFNIDDLQFLTKHNPNSAMDLSLRAPLQSAKTLGVPESGTATIPAPENANKFDPRINAILDHLAGREIPVRGVTDSPGGTTYIKAKNPVDDKNIVIRVPDPGNNHAGRGDIIGKHINKNGPGSYFDLGTPAVNTKSAGGVQRRQTNQNESGQFYGDDLDALYKAIDAHTMRALVPEGMKPNYNSKSREAVPSAPSEKLFEHPELPFPNPNEVAMEQAKPNLYGQDLHSLIDQHVQSLYGNNKPIPEQIKDSTLARASMEKPQLTVNEMKEMSLSTKDILRKFEFLRE